MDTVHECDRQTDGQTDGRTDRITITKTVQTASHGKNNKRAVWIVLYSGLARIALLFHASCFNLYTLPESQLDWTVSDYRGNCALQLTCHIIRRTPSLQSIDIALKLSQLLHDVLYGRAATINRLINY